MVNHNVNHKDCGIDKTLVNSGKKRILFVCLGNICRSPAAEGMFRAIVEERDPDPSRWTIDSAGTGRYHIGDLPDHRMRVHARRRGLELTHHARQVTADDFSRFDLIIGMDDSNIANLRRIAPSPEAEKKIRRMSDWFPASSLYDHVPDPYYEGSEGFELVLDLLSDACMNLYNEYAAK